MLALMLAIAIGLAANVAAVAIGFALVGAINFAAKLFR